MRLLALDVGEKRIGVAVSDPSGTLATAREVLIRRSLAEDLATLVRLVAEYGAEEVIVGLPLNWDGTVGWQARRVTQYANRLAAHLPVPVRLWDERLTTEEADSLLAQAGRRGSDRRKRLDAAAAALILQDYLEARRRGEPEPPAIPSSTPEPG